MIISYILIMLLFILIAWIWYEYSKVGGFIKIFYFRHRKFFPPASCYDHPNKFIYLLNHRNIEHIVIDGSYGNIGAWFISNKNITNSKVVVIVCHGIKFSRGVDFRIQFYNSLVDLNYIVVAFDYCGFGDSDGIPSIEGLINDTICVYNHTKKMYSDDTNIFIWGHSMGVGPALKAATLLSEDNRLKGVILDAPFYNSRTIINFKLGKLCTMFFDVFWKGYIDSLFNNSLALSQLDHNIPVLFIHSINDHVIPYKFCKMLQNETKNVRWNNILQTEPNCGHNFNFKSFYFPKYIQYNLQ